MEQMKFAFFDAKPYDQLWFDKLNTQYQIRYIGDRLSADTAHYARGCRAAVAFVNDKVDTDALISLKENGVEIVLMRSAGHNNVDVACANDLGITVTTVPDYSPHSIAEHAMALTLALNRNIHRAYARIREFNFSLNGLNGVDMYGKTMGIIGTGRIGRVLADISKGFGMNVIAYDPFPNMNLGVKYVRLDELFSASDVISLNCPLTEESRHMLSDQACNIQVLPQELFVSQGSLCRFAFQEHVCTVPCMSEVMCFLRRIAVSVGKLLCTHFPDIVIVCADAD